MHANGRSHVTQRGTGIPSAMVANGSPPRSYGKNGENGNNEPNYRDAKLIAEQARIVMDRLNITPIEPILPPHKDPGQYGEDTLDVTTNLYGIRLPRDKTIHRYQVDINLVRPLTARRPGSSPSHSSSDENDHDNGNGRDEDDNGNSSNGNGNGGNGNDGNGHNENGHANGNGHSSSNSVASSDKLVINWRQARRRGDPLVIQARDEYRKIWNAIFATNQLPGIKEGYYFDLQSTLYSVEFVPGTEEEKGKTIEVLTDVDLFPRFESVQFVIRHTGTVILGQFQNEINLDLARNNTEMMRFLEVATSQDPLLDPTFVVFAGGRNYLSHPEEYGFEDDDKVELTDNAYCGIGNQKSIRYVEGPNGRNHFNAAIVIESKKTPFHLPDLVVNKAYAMKMVDDDGRVKNGYTAKDFEEKFKGLYVVNEFPSNPDASKTMFRIVAVDTNSSARTFTFPWNDAYGEEHQITIYDYYRQHRGIDLMFPDSPVVMVRVNPRDKFPYPMEAIRIVDFQRVTAAQQSPDMVGQLIKACAILPSKMQLLIAKHLDALRLTDAYGYSEFLKSAELKVISQPLKAKARRLAHPAISYSDGMTKRVNEHGGWQLGTAKFVLPARCDKWVAAYISNGELSRELQEKTLKVLTRQMLDFGRSHGMIWEDPKYLNFIRNNHDELKSYFEHLKTDGIEFAFFVTQDEIKNMHYHMKLNECKYEIVTQDLNSTTADNIIHQNQRITLENVILKTNVKLGGLNHRIMVDIPHFKNVLDPTTLFIGFGVVHPVGAATELQVKETEQERERLRQGGMSEPPLPPSVVGFAANDGKDPLEITGDYIFQLSRRDEKITLVSRTNEDHRPLLIHVIDTILDRFRKNRGCLPKNIVVYRNGASEGQFANILVHEVPFIRQAMINAGCGTASLVFIVATKLHPVRIYPDQVDPHASKAPDLNIKPGHVIDTNLVHPTRDEFYLCSHTTLQGTAKIPRYTIIYDESNFTVDQVEEMTYALTYGHQIVNSPTSLPSPVFIAERYAERGRNVYKAYMESNADNVEMLESFYFGGTEQQRIALCFLNEKITLHCHRSLRCRRINA